MNANLAQIQITNNLDNLKQPEEYFSIKANNAMLEDVFSVRYRAYVANDSIDANQTKRFFDEYDRMDNCQSYLTYLGNNIVGSIRACTFIPGQNEDIPAMEIFEQEIKDNIGIDKPFVESNKFVVVPEFQRRGGVRARFHLFQNAVSSALEVGADRMITAVRPEHVRFYKIFHCQPISKIKSYPHLKFDTVLLANYDLPKLKEYICSKAS